MSQYRKLAPYPYVRLRTEIYLGSREPVTQNLLCFDGETLALKDITYVPALFTYFREILDNALDEVVGRKHGRTIRVTFDPAKLEFEVEDDGRGIPIKHDDKLGGIPAVVLLSEVQAGSNFDEAELRRLGLETGDPDKAAPSRGQWAGANGVGGSVVNYVSEYFRLDVWREKKHFGQTWNEGTQKFKTNGHRINAVSGGKTGTRVQFKPSEKVFKNLILPEELIRSHLWMVAAANRKSGLRLYYNGEQIRVKDTADPVVSCLFEKIDTVIPVQINSLINATYYLVPNFHADSETIYSLVNNVPAFNGGTHIDSFRNAFYPAMMTALEARAKREKIKGLRRDDLSGGLLIFNVTQMNAPDFDAQSKSRLQNTNIVPLIKAGITAEMIEKLIRNNKAWIDAIMERAKLRQGQTDNKLLETEQKKMARSKVAKLQDATSHNRSDCILFMGEGNSAVKGGLVSERDPKIHGVLPLRGKVENALDMKPNDVLKSAVYSDILKSIGLVVGKKAVRDSLRYGSVYIATDEDEDGQHITALLVNFFFKFWPELFDPKQKPFFFKFCTPFIIASKGKETKYFYGHQYEDFVKESDKYSKAKGWDITRAKGLGTLKREHWRYALTTPFVLPFYDDGKLAETLDLCFNKKRSDDRKVWLTNDE